MLKFITRRIFMENEHINHINDLSPMYIECYKSREAIEKGYPDAWTIVFTRLNDWMVPKDAPDWLVKEYQGQIYYIGMNKDGSLYHGNADNRQSNPGILINFKDLNIDQRMAIIKEYEKCWKIKMKIDDKAFPIEWEQNSDES
jgi:hypothetical protein